jgi:hypothetical protein
LSVGGLIPGAVGDVLGAAAPPDGAAVVVDGAGTLELLYVVVPGAFEFAVPLSPLFPQPDEMTAKVTRTKKARVLRISLSPTNNILLRAAMSILLSGEFCYKLGGVSVLYHGGRQ